MVTDGDSATGNLMRARSLAVTSLVLGALAAGCFAPVAEPTEGASDRRYLDLARIVLGKELVKERTDAPYGYHSGTFNGSWAAFRMPIPPEAIGTNEAGKRFARVHAVMAFLDEKNQVIQAPRPSSLREADATGPIVQTIGYRVAQGSILVESYGRVEPTIAPTYNNFTIEEANDGMPTEALLLVAAIPGKDARPLHLALVLKIGEDPDGVMNRDMYVEALRGLSNGGRGARLVPVAEGEGVSVSLYEESQVGADGFAKKSIRDVTVEDETTVPTSPVADVQRRLRIAAARDLASTTRVIGGSFLNGTAQTGEWSWSYTSPGDAAATGSHGFADAKTLGAPTGVLLLRNEPPGPIELAVQYEISAAALPSPLFIFGTFGIDLERVFGVPAAEFGPGSESPIPPFFGALRQGLASASA